MSKFVEFFLCVNFVVFCSIKALADDDRSISEILRDDKEISLLYSDGTSSLVKTDDDLKLFALVESYKSHLYEIRHSKNSPIFADYTNDYYAESVYTTILTELAKFALNADHYGVASKIIFCGGDIYDYSETNYNYLVFVNTLNEMMYGSIDYSLAINKVGKALKALNIYNNKMIGDAETDIYSYIKGLRLNEFIYDIKEAKLKKSAAGFANKLRNALVFENENGTWFSIKYRNTDYGIGGENYANYYFKIQYDENSNLLEQTIKVYEGNSPVNIHGLVNLGGTCWFNASMQFLNASEGFREFIEAGAKICRAKHDDRFEIDNIFVILHNIFNLINSNISLEPETETVGMDGKAKGYTKAKLERQFTRLMKRIKFHVDFTNGKSASLLMTQILLEIARTVNETQMEIISKVESEAPSDAETVEVPNNELNDLWIELVTALNATTTKKIVCDQGHTVLETSIPLPIVSICVFPKEKADDIIKKCFYATKPLDDKIRCKKCKSERNATTEVEVKPAASLVFSVNAENEKAKNSAKLNMGRFVCPTDNNEYVLKASIWQRLNDPNARHVQAIIRYGNEYIAVSDHVVQWMGDKYEAIIPEDESEMLVLYERVEE